MGFFSSLFQRSISSHREISRRPLVLPGIALSAPAILTRHEYPETLLKQSSSSKSVKKYSPSKKSKIKSEKFRSVNRKEIFDFSSIRTLPSNLPEFIHFQSDHLIQRISLSSADRSRTSSIHHTSKSLGSQTPPTPHSPNRRISQKHSPRSLSKRFDSMSCFDEVS